MLVRTITALIIAAVFLICLWKMPPPILMYIISAVVIIGAWEWAQLCWRDNIAFQMAYCLCFTALLMIIMMHPAWVIDGWRSMGMEVLGAALIGWTLIIFFMLHTPASQWLWNSRLVRSLMGFILLVPAWWAIAMLRTMEYGEWLVLYTVLLIACMDVGAYIFGRTWGRKPLAPRMSPGKTWVGLYSGMALASGFAVSALWLFPFLSMHILWISIVVASFSLYGDLVESAAKRQQNIKDSSRILPGHGGVLDRIDSLTLALPLFTFLWWHTV